MEHIKRVVVNDIEKNGLSLVIYKDPCTLIYRDYSPSIKPLYNFVKFEKDKFSNELLYVGDKVIGKASALLIAFFKPVFVYGATVSAEALPIFKRFNIEFEYKNLVPFIQNRDKTDMCPFEKAVIDVDVPEVALWKIEETFKRLSSSSS